MIHSCNFAVAESTFSTIGISCNLSKIERTMPNGNALCHRASCYQIPCAVSTDECSVPFGCNITEMRADRLYLAGIRYATLYRSPIMMSLRSPTLVSLVLSSIPLSLSLSPSHSHSLIYSFIHSLLHRPTQSVSPPTPASVSLPLT